MSATAIRIAILADSPLLSTWENEILRRIASRHPNVEFSLITLDGSGPENSSFAKALRRLPFRLVRKLELIKLRRSPLHLAALERQLISIPIDRSVTVVPEWSDSGHSWWLSDTDCRVVRDLNAHVIIRMCSGIIRGELLHLSNYGILSLHHGDNQRYRGLPPGFWEVLESRPVSGYVVQRLCDELDGGSVIASGAVATQTYALRNQSHLFLNSVPAFVEVLHYLISNESLPPAKPSLPYTRQLYREPGPRDMARYVRLQLTRLVKKGLSRLPGRREAWSVGIVRQPWNQAVLWRSKEISPAPNTWLADPFLTHWNNQDLCFVEEFLEREGRGRIAVFDLSGGQQQRVGVALEDEGHFSFPFTFVLNEELFMVPETIDKNQIRLYRCLGDPREWTLHKVLVDGIRAADTQVFHLDGYWYMLTNEDREGTGDFASNLSVFWSRGLFDDTWSRISPLSVVADPECQRNGGLLFSGSRLFRVGQVSDFDSYGSSFKILEITDISPEQYSERAIQRVHPDFRSDIKGTHHLTGTGRLTAVDMYRS